MSVGERGGRTATAEQGFEAIETFKHTIADQVRADILGWLDGHATWHRDNLRVPLAPADKNAVGAVVGGLVSSGVIVETGERRKSADPASHGRKSNVFKLQRSGNVAPSNSGNADEGGVVMEPEKNRAGLGRAPARTGGSRVGTETSAASSSGSNLGGDPGPGSIDRPGTADQPSQESGRAGEGETALLAPRLFDVGPEPTESYYESERAA